jgi:hypothetical protein
VPPERRRCLDAIADVIPDIGKVSDPTRVRSPWLNGHKTFEVTYR